MNKPLILAVEDDRPVRTLIATTLKAHGYRHLEAATGEAALLEASSHNPDIILLDLGLPDLDGVEVITRPSSSLARAARMRIKSALWMLARMII